MNELVSIDVSSGVNESGKGFVTVTARDQNRKIMVGQLPPDELRAMALRFLEVAEAAETDAIVYRLLGEKFGLEPPYIGAFINDMRGLREGYE